MRTFIVVLLVLSTSACGGSVAGRATGLCDLRYASRDPAPALGPFTRDDVAVAVELVEAGGGDVNVRFAGCDLVVHRDPDGPETHYLVTSGHCRADVPSLGLRDFDVRHRVADGSRTEDSGEDAYVNLAGTDVFISFDAPLDGNWVAFSCKGTRVP